MAVNGAIVVGGIVAAATASSYAGVPVELKLGPISLCLIGSLLVLFHRLSTRAAEEQKVHCRPIQKDEFEAAGWGAPNFKDGAGKAQGPEYMLYVDLLKRALCNIIYYETSQALWIYGADHKFRLACGFELDRRTVGEDMPGNAHTMIGLKRLQNIEDCVGAVIDDKVEGDLLECGACKGGACVFMRGVLKARGDTTRKVYVADTFEAEPPQAALPVKILIGCVLYVLASIPSRSWQRWLCFKIQALDKNFPPMDPAKASDDLVEVGINIMKNVLFLEHPPRVEKSYDCVKSNFARFGLLDEQVVLLRGWFADTMAEGTCPYKKLSVLRADGDTYESTIDALKLGYPRLSAGGFCIIDDYWSFDACKQAVDEYRAEHKITAPLIKIDGLSCYWRK